MRLQRRDRRVGLGPGPGTVLALVSTLSFAPAAMAQDTGRIRITLTVPQTIHARVSGSLPTRWGHDVCVVSADSVAFSVAALVDDVESWRLRPLRPAAPAPGRCAGGVTWSIEAGEGRPVTLVFSPE